MGLSLSHDVVEVVTDGDEHEALLDELSDALSAEQEETQDLVVLAASSDHFTNRVSQHSSRHFLGKVTLTLVSGSLELSGEVHLGEFVLLKETH